ncbi:MAG: S24/S26 family peptidase [Deltaproteobacteria bacterium]|nr:S24/S26 family peptidase [Deltaproteobacteria bacterium]
MSGMPSSETASSGMASSETALSWTASSDSGLGEGAPELLLDLLARGQHVTLRARGASMLPLVHDGDVLTLASLLRPRREGESVRPLRVGELVLAVRGEDLRVHRVIALEAGRARLRGDALHEDDGVFDLAHLHGRVVAVRRGDRPLSRWRWAGRLPLVLVWAFRLLRRARALLRRRAISGHLRA